MARDGFEHASTAAIARAAGTSESQLVRHFENKSGLLLAVFDEAWNSLNTRFEKAAEQSASAVEAIQVILGLFLAAMQADPSLATLMLFEGRRIRYQEGGIQLSHGFLRFERILVTLIERAQQEGSIDSELKPMAIYTGLLGLGEGMARHRMIQKRLTKPANFSQQDIRRLFATLIRGLRPQKT